MTTGIDFDDDPIYMEKLIKEQIIDAENANNWAENDEKTISAELSGVVSRVTNCINHLSKLIDNRDFYTTDSYLKALAMNDVGAGGWIPSFIKSSKGFLKHPEDEKVVWDHLKNNYDAGRKFINDLELLNTSCGKITQLLMVYPLEGIYDTITWVLNFSKGGFNKKMYDQIATDIRVMANTICVSETSIRDRISEAYYAEYQDKLIAGGEGLDHDVLKAKYQEKRHEDYKVFFESRKISQNLALKDDGTFKVPDKWMNQMGVIDSYTYILTHRDPVETRIDEMLETCSSIIVEDLIANEKQLENKQCISVNDAFKKLVHALKDFAQRGKDCFTKFYEGTEAPYCFMKLMEELRVAPTRYDFQPSKANPWDHGTEFKDIYEDLASSFKKQYDEFVKKNGVSHLRDE